MLWHKWQWRCLHTRRQKAVLKTASRCCSPGTNVLVTHIAIFWDGCNLTHRETHLYRWHRCQSRCHCPGKLVWQIRQAGSPGNKWNGPHVQQSTWSQIWFREQGLPEKGRWWELWEREKELERNVSHMWNKLPDILWHSPPEDIHVSLGSAVFMGKDCWNQMLHLQSQGREKAILVYHTSPSSLVFVCGMFW